MILFRKSGDEVDPIVLNFIKNSIGLVLLVISMLVLGEAFFPASASLRDWLVVIGSGTLGIAVADSLLFASLTRIGAGRAAIVGCMYSPSVIIIAVLFLGESLTPVLIISTLLVVSAIVIGTYQPRSKVRDKVLLVGVLIGLSAEFSMAVGIVMVKPVLEAQDAWWLTTARLAGAMPLLLLQVLGSPKRRQLLLKALKPGRHWRVVAPASLIGAYFALILWILGFKYTYATTAAVLNQTSTLFLIVLATLVLREPMSLRKAIAVALGFAGAVMVVI